MSHSPKLTTLSISFCSQLLTAVLKPGLRRILQKVLSKIARGQQDNPGEEVASNKGGWKKLARNVERDKEVNDQLTQQGWLVLRFWESDIKKDIGAVVAEIESYMP